MDPWRQLSAAQDLARLPNKRPAILALEKLLAESPDNADALAVYSHCLLTSGRVPEAHAAARRALELEPEHPDALVQLGWSLYVRDRDKEAGICADAAIAADPGHPGGWWLRADWALFTKRYSKAEEAARQLLSMDPSDADAHAYLGRALLAKGILGGAHDALTEALRLDPEHGVARRALAAVVVREARGEGRKPLPERGPRRWLRQMSAATRAPGVRAAQGGLLVAVTGLGFLAVRGGQPAWIPALAVTFAALAAWTPPVLAEHAPQHARVRGVVAAVGLLAACALGLTGSPDDAAGGAHGALWAVGALALWTGLRAVAQVAGLGRSEASLAAEIDPAFGVDPGAYKADLGYQLLRQGDGALARQAFRAIGAQQEYSPAAADGRQLATMPEWSALFPGTVAEESWARAPARLRSLRDALTAASSVAFLVGCWHAAMGRPWYALLHSALIALGATFAATAFDPERRRPMRALYLVSGSLVALWPLAVLFAPPVARVHGLEAAVYSTLALRFLMAAGDLGERLDAGTNSDPSSGDPWAW